MHAVDIEGLQCPAWHWTSKAVVNNGFHTVASIDGQDVSTAEKCLAYCTNHYSQSNAVTFRDSSLPCTCYIDAECLDDDVESSRTYVLCS